MSEYQYVVFRAVDVPVSKKHLAYMEKQSSRAEITPWSFENEYNFGDFHGNALGMLQRGYDFHLHYANFGIRKLMFRLPSGFPDSAAADKYLTCDAIEIHSDKSGPGLILEFSPNDESGGLDQIFDFHELIEDLIQLRAEIIEGDLRPLYLMNLIAALFYGDEEAVEAPVPYGLNTLTDPQLALAKFYGIGDSLLKAVGNNIPDQKKSKTGDDAHAAWLRKQTSSQKDVWLGKLMVDPHSNIRVEILTEFRSQQKTTTWPVVERNRRIIDLEADAEEIDRQEKAKKADAAQRKKAKRLAEVAANPDMILRGTEDLVREQNSEAYRQIANLLSELREAFKDSDQAELAEQHAQNLKATHPYKVALHQALRKSGFLQRKKRNS